MARTATALAAATLALILAACSSTATTSGTTGAGSTTATTTSAATTPAGGGGSVDCSALTGDDAGTYTVGIQILAQLRSQDVVDSIKAGGMTYDPEAMARILTKLKSLAGHGVLGDPSADVDFYLAANEKARAILAVSGPVPQGMFDDIVAFEGDIGTFIGRQVSISAAYSDACG